MKQIKFKFIVLLLLILNLSIAQAEVQVDMRSLALIDKEVDFAGLFPMRRVYSSRSYQKGHFGFGWCSSLELELKGGKTNPKLYRCGIFDSGFTSIALSKTIDGFHRETREGSEEFNIEGRLIAVTPMGGKRWLLHYDKLNRISEITLPQNSNRFKFFYNKESDPDLITSIEGPKNQSIRFVYSENGELILVITGTTQKQFKYDILQNLIEVKDNESVHIQYDSVHDRVLELKSENCTSHYRVLAKKILSYSTEALRLCQKEVAIQEIFHFVLGRPTAGISLLTAAWSERKIVFADAKTKGDLQ